MKSTRGSAMDKERNYMESLCRGTTLRQNELNNNPYQKQNLQQTLTQTRTSKINFHNKEHPGDQN
jgi:hypothetical protein